jgi:hypothetical protein
MASLPGLWWSPGALALQQPDHPGLCALPIPSLHTPSFPPPPTPIKTVARRQPVGAGGGGAAGPRRRRPVRAQRRQGALRARLRAPPAGGGGGQGWAAGAGGVHESQGRAPLAPWRGCGSGEGTAGWPCPPLSPANAPHHTLPHPRAGWAYSEALVRCLEDYRRRFPWLWAAVERDPSPGVCVCGGGGGGGGWGPGGGGGGARGQLLPPTQQRQPSGWWSAGAVSFPALLPRPAASGRLLAACWQALLPFDLTRPLSLPCRPVQPSTSWEMCCPSSRGSSSWSSLRRCAPGSRACPWRAARWSSSARLSPQSPR